MTGLFHDETLLDAVKRRIRGEAVAQAVRAIERGVKTDQFSIFFDEEIHCIFTEMRRSDLAIFQDLPEDRAVMDISGLQPVLERTDAVHFFRHILQLADADLLAFAPLVRL